MDSPDSSTRSDCQLSWTYKASWPPLLGGGRQHHEMVVVPTNSCADRKSNAAPQGSVTVAVLGGLRYGPKNQVYKTNSVVLMDLSTDPKHIPQWREGPKMITSKYKFAAVACNGGVYAIDTTGVMERIDIDDLVKHSEKGPEKQPWSTLPCRLAAPRMAFAAAVVEDRYIVLVGGQSGEERHKPLYIEVFDTQDSYKHALLPVPKEHVPRTYPSTVAVGNKVYIIGGRRLPGETELDSVECIEFKMKESEHDDAKSQTQGVSTSGHFDPKVLSWKLQYKLRMSAGRSNASCVLVGSKIVVAGGAQNEHRSRSVEVLDLERQTVSLLPNMKERRWGPFLVALPDGGMLFAVGVGLKNARSESLCFGGPLVKPQPLDDSQKSEDSSRGGVVAKEKRPAQVDLENLDEEPKKRQKNEPEVKAPPVITPDSSTRGEKKLSILERLRRLEAAVEPMKHAQDLEKRVQTIEVELKRQKEDTPGHCLDQQDDKDEKTLLHRIGSLEQKVCVSDNKQPSDQDGPNMENGSVHVVSEETQPCDVSNETMSAETETPDAVPNMTVQDRVSRLEATVIGSTMLYSAWILWNHWTA